MFLRSIFLLILLLAGSTSFSQEMTAAENALQQKLQDYNRASAAANAAAELARSAYSDAVSNYGKKMATAAGSTWTSLTSSVSSLVSRAQASAAKAITPNGAEAGIDAATLSEQEENLRATEAAQAKANGARALADGSVGKALDASNKTFKAATDAIAKATSGTASAAYLKMKEVAIDARLSAFGLHADMASLTSSFKDINEAKTLLERKLDKSIMASYMQEKFTKLLNSDVFCQAASAPSCQKGKNTSMFKTSDMKTVFTNADSVSKAASSSTGSGTTTPWSAGSKR